MVDTPDTENLTPDMITLLSVTGQTDMLHQYFTISTQTEWLHGHTHTK